MLGIPVGVATDRLFAISTTPVVLGVATSAAVGVFFGLYPARRASHRTSGSGR